MKWYEGSIAEAVSASKSRNAIFVVFVEGKDESTLKINKFIDDTRIKEKLQSDNFVAIKIESESQSYMQFASIYQVVPVPSMFFIGQTGTPLEIATAALSSIEELETKIIKVLQISGKSKESTTNAKFIQDEQTASTSGGAIKKNPVTEEVNITEATVIQNNIDSTTEVVCDGDVCYKKPVESTADKKVENTDQQEEQSKEPTLNESSKPSQSTEQQQQQEQSEEAKLNETRKYLEEKRQERVEEEKRLEKERELQRRKEGKDIQNLRAWQKDQELKELKDTIKKERLEEQAARERIRAQIAADKVERAQKFAKELPQAQTKAEENAASSQQRSTAAPDESRIQFRFASGDNNSNIFKCSTTLAELREYVRIELLPGTGIRDFTLATTYPKREFSQEHDNKTIIELELFPSAVILVIGKEATGPRAAIARSGGFYNMFVNIIMSIFNPIFGIFSSAKNWITGGGRQGNNGNQADVGSQKRANEENIHNDLAKRRNLDRFLQGNSNDASSSNNSSDRNQAYRRYVGGSNVHRLTDRKDSDDENATWNGNSTQQQ